MSRQKHTSRLKRGLASFVMSILLLGSSLPQSQAIILFQNDDFFDMESPNLMIDSTDRSTTTRVIQFGNTTDVGTFTWNVADSRFELSDELYLTNELTVNGGYVDMSAASGLRLRESANPTTSAACTNVDEVIINTTLDRLEICTATGIAGSATWVAASGSASSIQSEAAAPGTCTEGDVYYNTTSDKLFVCTATDTWSEVGPSDFEAIYANDGDGILTTSDSNFGINTGTANFNVDGAALSLDGTTSSNFTVTGNDAGNVGLTLSATNAGAGEGNVSISASDNVSISSSTWDISGAGVASGFTGITSTGTIDFSGSSQTRIRETATVTNGATTCANAGELIIETSTNSMYICTDAGTDTWKKAAGNKLGNLTFTPQYPNATIHRDGTNNIGTLVTEYDGTENDYYYGWRTNNGNLNDINVRTRFVLPNDFSSIDDFTLRYITGTVTTTDNKLDVVIRNITDAETCHTSADNAVAGTWTTLTITAAQLEVGCTDLGAGDTIEADFKLYDRNGGTTYTRIGTFTLGYNN